MSMTRDAYAKEVLRIAEAALYHNEHPVCPHDGCSEILEVIWTFANRTRAIVCPVHGPIFKEQEHEPFSDLDWEAAEARVAQSRLEEGWDDGEDEEFEDDLDEGYDD
ncbi:MAG: hypothetical protein QHH26_07085 [Armatimonadota bacterium]|nr:hypothetical protein [Armatimonadota bacterium]